VKQLLLRVPEDLHRRLALRAGRQGRSMNAVATEILDAVPEGEWGDRRARLRAAAAAAGILDTAPGSPTRMSARQRRRIIDSTRGLGRQLDGLLSEERDR
jgi:plasmid stability protein